MFSRKYQTTKSQLIIQAFTNLGIEFLPYLPCGEARKVLDHFQVDKKVTMIPLAREEEGIGILAGLEAAGKKGVLFIQDSGIGNALNAYITLGVAYNIPMLIIASRRGGFREINPTNAMFGEITPGLIDACRSEFFILDYKIPFDQWSDVVENSYNYAHFMRKPVILLVNFKD